MPPNLHIGFSRRGSGGLVFPSLEEFPTVSCDPHKGFGIVNKTVIDVFLELSSFFLDLVMVLMPGFNSSCDPGRLISRAIF